MSRLFLLSLAAACGLTYAWAPTAAHAQYVTYYRPTVSYYAPAVAAPAATVYAAPAAYTVASPVVTPAPTIPVVPAPVVPAPVVAAPVVAAPVVAPAVPVVTYYRPATVTYSAVPEVVTRYRPFLGGSVSRVRYSYRPVILP